MKIQTINEQRKGLEQALGKDTPPRVLAECKRAFFAGFASCLVTLTGDIPQLSDHDAEAAIISLNLQCLGFAEAIKLGAA